MGTRIDEIVGGIYRISTWQSQYGITHNQFLIADGHPALIHTGMRDLHGPILNAIREVLDPAKLAYVVLLHWEGDENGGMEQFMKEAPKSELIDVKLHRSEAASSSRPSSSSTILLMCL